MHTYIIFVIYLIIYEYILYVKLVTRFMSVKEKKMHTYIIFVIYLIIYEYILYVKLVTRFMSVKEKKMHTYTHIRIKYRPKCD
jgi:hypothetical protein